MEIMLVIIAALQAYLFGSLNFAVIFSKIFGKKDIRQFGSGNAGMTNMMRVYGFLPGILTFLCDVLKGAAACFVGRYIIFSYLNRAYGGEWFSPIYGAVLCGIFCVIGHIYPCFFEFKGGKAVAVSVGIFYLINWKVITAALIIFAAVLLLSHIISISSLAATLAVFFGMAFFPPHEGKSIVVIIGTFIICAIVFAKHCENIKRLIKHEEKPIF